jgi:hypothetical protein
MAEPEEYTDPAEQIVGMLMGLGGQLGAAMAESTRPPRYEYRRVSWDDVNELARDGWMLCPMVIQTSTLPLFVVVRQLGAADEAAELLRARELGLPRITLPGEGS